MLNNNHQKQATNGGTATAQDSSATQQKVNSNDAVSNGAALQTSTASNNAPATKASSKAKDGEKWIMTANGDSVPANDAAVKRWTKRYKEEAKITTDNVAIYMKRVKELYKPLSERIGKFQEVGLQSIYGDYSSNKYWDLKNEIKDQRNKIAKSIENDPKCLSIKKRSKDIDASCQFSEYDYQVALNSRFEDCIEKWKETKK